MDRPTTPTLTRGRFITLVHRAQREETCNLGHTHWVTRVVEAVDVWLPDTTKPGRGITRDGRTFIRYLDERGIPYWLDPEGNTWGRSHD